MLAVKFYHIRSLIYRPCVALSSYSSLVSTPTDNYNAERQNVLMAKRTCIQSAQKTAHLLYGLEGKQNLVHDFPWWQMISCLICASSILLVAKLDIDREELARHLNMDGIEEDAEVCLKVFEALSTNSNAARLARDMMRGLKESRVHSQGKIHSLRTSFARLTHSTTVPAVSIKTEKAPATQHIQQVPSSGTPNSADLAMPMQQMPNVTDSSTLQYSTFGMPLADDFGYADFPNFNEISEPILWSAQFVNAEYNPFINPAYDESG